MPPGPDRSRRGAFDPVSAEYDAVRPGYPDEIFAAAVAGLPAGARVLEVGCGTGQWTGPFVEAGCDVTCVELGANMAAAVRAKYGVPVHESAFEDWDAPAAAFDLVTAAQAWHWVEPDRGQAQVAHVLRPGGRLALVWNLHPGLDHDLARDVAEVYRARAPELAAPPKQRPLEERIEERRAELAERYGPVAVFRHRWEQPLTTDRYLRLIDTYSDHRALAPDLRADLYAGLRELLDACGGAVRRPYVAVLFRCDEA